IIVVNFQEITVGLIVDAVQEVLDIPETQIDSPPSINKGSESRFLQGLGKVGDAVKIILDIERFLYEEELMQITESMAS
ncbi:MAG: chemotaxis protein CheW, partial [Calditrichia bacterium]